MMTPEQFFEKVMGICTDNRDVEALHSMTDTLMENLLIDLGYGDGIDIIRSTERWYA